MSETSRKDSILRLGAAVDEFKQTIFDAFRIPQIVQWLAQRLSTPKDSE